MNICVWSWIGVNVFQYEWTYKHKYVPWSYPIYMQFYTEMITCAMCTHTHTELSILTICVLFLFSIHLYARSCWYVYVYSYFFVFIQFSVKVSHSLFYFPSSQQVIPTSARHLKYGSISKLFASVIFLLLIFAIHDQCSQHNLLNTGRISW